MSRNYQELGLNLQKIVNRLIANDDLINLLYYTDIDPLGQEKLSQDIKKTLLNDLIYIVPKVDVREDSKSVLAIFVPKASSIGANSEFNNISVAIDVMVPLQQWIIKDSNLRPFAIMGEISNSLNGKTINGLGKIKGGDFDLTVLTNEMSIYRQQFWITQYD